MNEYGGLLLSVLLTRTTALATTETAAISERREVNLLTPLPPSSRFADKDGGDMCDGTTGRRKPWKIILTAEQARALARMQMRIWRCKPMAGSRGRSSSRVLASGSADAVSPARV
jgi:hypothetical protein